MDTCKDQTPAEKIYQVAKDCLGQDISLDQSIPDSVQCAEAVSFILRKCGYDIPSKGIPGTATLLAWLKNNPLFRLWENPDNVDGVPIGCVIISPAGESTKGFMHGHVGITAKQGILSNDSNTGLFLELFDTQSWYSYFGNVRGLPTYIYEPI